MRNNTQDKTLERNYLSKWKYMIKDYELVKKNKHPKFRFVSDFYKFHKTNRQTFLKYYHRYLNCPEDQSLLPRKRGPQWKSRRRSDIDFIEEMIKKHRRYGINRYELCFMLNMLLKKLGKKTLSPSFVYRIFKKRGINRLTPKMKEERRRIIKEKAGELGHIDCHYLGKDLIVSASKRYYLVCLMDDCTRVTWVDVVEDIRSLTVMFSALKILSLLEKKYRIRFKEMMSDNGPEFSSRQNKNHHPFEKLLLEMEIKHRYTKPYRPQTNGKVERFWRTLNEDLIEGTTFETIEEFKDELEQYLIYYNEARPHQGIDHKTPAQMNAKSERARV